VFLGLLDMFGLDDNWLDKFNLVGCVLMGSLMVFLGLGLADVFGFLYLLVSTLESLANRIMLLLLGQGLLQGCLGRCRSFSFLDSSSVFGLLGFLRLIIALLLLGYSEGSVSNIVHQVEGGLVQFVFVSAGRIFPISECVEHSRNFTHTFGKEDLLG